MLPKKDKMKKNLNPAKFGDVARVQHVNHNLLLVDFDPFLSEERGWAGLKVPLA